MRKEQAGQRGNSKLKEPDVSVKQPVRERREAIGPQDALLSAGAYRREQTRMVVDTMREFIKSRGVG